MYKIFQYDDDNFRIVCIPDREEKKNNLSNEDVNSEESLRCSISRSKRMIREYALSNHFTYFFTSTVNSKFADRYSLDECQSKIRRICDYCKRKNKDFIYLYITEKHLDGAFHFHGLCSHVPDLYINKNGYLSSKLFDTLGFNSFSKIKDLSKVSNYILKYITQDCIKNSKGSLYFCSRGLKKSYSYEIMPVDFSLLQKEFSDVFSHYYFNEYCKLFDFRLSDLTIKEKLFIQNYIKEPTSFLDILKNRLQNGHL